MFKTVKSQIELTMSLICLTAFAFVYPTPIKFPLASSALSVMLAFGLSVIFSKKTSRDKLNYLRLPTVKYLPVKIPFVEGLITVVKAREVGVRLFDTLSAKYGPSFVLPSALTSLTVLADPVQIQAILGSARENTLNKPSHLFKTVLPESMSNGLLGAPYSVWLPHRRVASSAFSYKGIAACLKYINNGAEKLIEECNTLAQETGIISNKNMQNLIDNAAIVIVSQIILGSENPNLTDSHKLDFNKNFKLIKDLFSERVQNPLQLLPFVWLLHPNRQRIERALENITKIVNKLSDQCYKDNSRAKDADNDADSTLGVKPFESLLQLFANASLSRQEINDEIGTFMAAGSETIATSINFLVLHLASNPGFQDACRIEVNEILERKRMTGGDALTVEDCAQMKYLERCILESMRLTPAVPMILRWVENPLEISPGVFLDGQTSILINIWGLHRNKTLYPNPEEFDPDRFLAEEIKRRHSYSFIPFSMGPRNCLGWKLALIEIKVIMAKLLNNYEFTTSETFADLKLDFNITLKPDRIPNVYYKKLP